MFWLLVIIVYQFVHQKTNRSKKMIIMLWVWLFFGLLAFILDVIMLNIRGVYLEKYPLMYLMAFVFDLPFGIISFLMTTKDILW